jgi:hypothetical protein
MRSKDDTNQTAADAPSKFTIVLRLSGVAAVVALLGSAIYLEDSHPNYARPIIAVFSGAWLLVVVSFVFRRVRSAWTTNLDQDIANAVGRCTVCAQETTGSYFGYYYGELAGGAAYWGGGGMVRETRFRILGAGSSFICPTCSHRYRLRARRISFTFALLGIVGAMYFLPNAIFEETPWTQLAYLAGGIGTFVIAVLSSATWFRTWTRHFVETWAFRLSKGAVEAKVGRPMRGFSETEHKRMSKG